MALKTNEYYIVHTEDNEGVVDLTTYQETAGVLSCIREAIEEDGVNPNCIRVYKGIRVRVNITLSKVVVDLEE